MNAPFRPADPAQPRHDWTLDEVEALFELPFTELVFRAAEVHRRWFDPTELQISQLLSVKTGGCAENCGYCAQSQHFKTGVKATKLMEAETVIAAAREAKAGGAQRFCMGAAWREVKDGPEFERVLQMVAGVKALGLETCATLGMLTAAQAVRLRQAGLDYYNHNLDTGRSHYAEVVTTRCYDDRLRTLANVRAAGVNVCCGGILGLGESAQARAELLCELANLDPPPESVPINTLVAVPGTPLAAQAPVPWDELVRMVAVARILMPNAVVRLSAGRDGVPEAAQAMCFLAGVNSIFVGEELLTTKNPSPESDAAMLARLGLRASTAACERS